MKDVKYINSDNAGSISILKYVPVEYVASIAENVAGMVDEVLFKNVNFKLFDIEFTTNKASFKEIRKKLGMFEYNLNIQISGDNVGLRNAIEEIENKELIIIFKDGNDKFRILGNLENGVKIYSTEQNKGEKIEDMNSYKIEFQWTNNERAFFFSNFGNAHLLGIGYMGIEVDFVVS